MKYKLIILIFLLIVIVITISINGIFLLVNYIHNNEKDNAKQAFEFRVESTLLAINNNISGITNEALSVGINVEKILATQLVNISEKIDLYRTMSNSIIENNKINISEVYFAYLAQNQNQVDYILEEAINMYKQPNMYIYDFDLSERILFPTDNLTFPKTPIFIITPAEKGPGIPRIGMPNLITADPQIESVFIMSDNSWDIPKSVKTINAIGNDIFRTNIFMRITNIMIGIGFIPFEFLKTLISDVNTLGMEVTIRESINTLYTNQEDNISLGRLFTKRMIDFKTESWEIEFRIAKRLEDSFKTDADIIIIIGGIVIILVVLTMIYFVGLFIQKKNDIVMLTEKNKHAKRVAILNQNSNHILHEIRNALSMPYIWFQNNLSSQERIANNETLLAIENSINNAVHMTSNILDFEKLISLNYQPQYQKCNINQYVFKHINSLPVKYLDIKIWSDFENMELISLDIEKLGEVLSNGLVNSITHSRDRSIIIRLSKLNDYIIIEIINKANNFTMNYEEIEKLFLPFFIKKEMNQQIWKETIDTVLTLDESIY